MTDKSLTAPKTDRLLNASQVQELLSISHTTLQSMKRDKELQYVKVRKAHRYRLSTIESIIAHGT